MYSCRKLQFLAYDYDFRDRYRYQNIMYSIAELVAETLDGRSWKDIMREEIFQPLGMTSSSFVTDESSWPMMANGHYVDGGDLRRVQKEAPKYDVI